MYVACQPKLGELSIVGKGRPAFAEASAYAKAPADESARKGRGLVYVAQNLLFAKALPDPDLRYFSKSRALDSSEKAI